MKQVCRPDEGNERWVLPLSTRPHTRSFTTQHVSRRTRARGGGGDGGRGTADSHLAHRSITNDSLCLLATKVLVQTWPLDSSTFIVRSFVISPPNVLSSYISLFRVRRFSASSALSVLLSILRALTIRFETLCCLLLLRRLHWVHRFAV